MKIYSTNWRDSRVKNYTQKVLVIFLLASLTLSPASQLFAQESDQPVANDQTAPPAVEGDTPASDSGQAPSSADDAPTQSDAPTSADTVIPDLAIPSAPAPTDSVSEDKQSDDKSDKEDQEGIASLSSGSGIGEGGINPQPVAYGTFSHDLVKIDKNTGALNMTYPIVVPPGRNNLQPDVSLVYNNQDSQPGSIFGEGWSIRIPYIERINKTGVNQFYGTSTPGYFISSLDGELATTTASSSYIARTENGAFNKYTFSSSTWVMTGKNGTRFTFGSSTISQQNDPNNSASVYRWMLQEVRDTNDNYVTYTYFKDAGQIYPSSTIYTGNGSTDGIFQVDFLRATSTDNATSSRAGFPVKSNYRISEITTKVSGSWVRKYALAYTTGDNGTTTLLSSITESGRDSEGAVITLAPVTFSYQTQTPGWTSSSTWNPPAVFAAYDYPADNGMRIADVNGDGLPDILFGLSNAGGPQYSAWINTGSGWATSSTWNPPIVFTSGTSTDNGVRIVDANGDGLPDILYGLKDATGTTHYGAWVNTGSGWASSSTWNPPAVFSVYGYADSGERIADINGDGLPDRLFGFSNSGGPQFYASINTGSGWTLDPSWAPPIVFTSSTSTDNGVRIVDANGDGLPDLLRGLKDAIGTTHFAAWLNNGNGWTSDPSWVPPAVFSAYPYADSGERIADVNGDGLPDRLFGFSNAGGPQYYASINTGNGWVASSTWNPPIVFTSSTSTDNGVRIVDVNGDGLPDILYGLKDATGTTHYAAWINNSTSRANLLTGVTYAKGGSSAIAYKSATQYMDGSGNVVNKEPYPVYVVSQFTNNDGSQDVSSSTYQYAGGAYYYSDSFDRQFAGFSLATTVDSAGNVTKTYYHTAGSTDSTHGEYQDNFWKIGKPYRVEVYDNSGNLYKKTINKWDSYSLGSNAAFVKLAQSVESDYDGLMTHKDAAESYTFDNATGNLTQKIQWGEVTGSDDGSFSDTGSDKFTTDFTYASSTSVIGKVSTATVTDQGASKVKETRYYYDNLSLGSVDEGNLTKRENWKSASTYVNTQNTYNGYGLVTQHLDERGKQTSYSYDAFNLYPATTTNALSQSTRHQYDYSSGKATQTKDPNNSVFETVFDGFDRALQVKQPDLSSSSTVVKTAYMYTDTANAVAVKVSDHLDATSTIDTYNYFDGLGRLVQTRKSAESAGVYKVTDRSYNNVGLLQKESLPYFAASSTKAAPTSTAALFTTYTYDPLGRTLTAVNAVGTTTSAYANWKMTTTDARGKPKDTYKDAHGNLARVDEHNGGNTYSTYYTYNGLQNLTSITDALGNVRNFTYDGLGRRLTAQDLHAAGDATYGSSTYAYDDAGNLTQTVDAKGQTVNYIYDDINRVLTEDYTGQAGTEFTYIYDSCTQGVTRLCVVSSTDAALSNTYNALGQIAQEAKTISSSTYTTSYTYDRQGNHLTITNPDSSQIKYEYNGAGLVEKVLRKESGGSFVDVVSGFDYSPTDQPATITYANGVVVANTYDPAQMYRLTRKIGTLPDASKAQDVTYTYDGVGNITQLVDASVSGTGKTVNYTYDDLSRLTVASTTSASSTPYGQTFSYDALGNITSGPAGTYFYNATSSAYANPHAVTSLIISTTTTSGAATSTPAFVQSEINSSGNSVTLGTSVTTGNLVIVGITAWNQSIPTSTVHDSKGNTYTRILEAVNTSTNDHAAIFYAKNVTGGSSFTVSSTISNVTISVHEYSGVATSSPLDQFASQTGFSATPTSGNVTTTIDHELYFGLAWSGGHGDTWTATSSFTLREQETDNNTYERHATEDKVVSTATSTAAKFTTATSEAWIAAIASFKPAVTPGSGTSTVTSTVLFTYDNNGNLVSTASTTNTWNYRNQLTQSVNAAGTSTYAYDHLGSRVKLSEGGVTTVFPSKFYNAMPGGGATTTKHIFANGLLVASIENATTTGGGSGTSTIALDATSTSITTGYNAGPVTKSWTHTVTGSSTLLVLTADLRQSVSGTGSVASATWKGVPFTKVGSALGGKMDSEIWYLAPTSTGSGTLEVTVTGATDAIKLGAASFTGVATSSPVDASSTATGTSGNPTINITTVTSSDLVVTTLSRNSTTTATTDRTALYNDNSSGGGGGGTTSTPAFVQSGIDSDEDPVTLSNSVTSGNLIAVGLTTWNTAIPTSSIHDNKGNTYTKVGEAKNGSDRAAIFYAANVTGGSSFTVSSTAGGTLSVHEYSGVATSSPLDMFATSTGTSATPQSGNVTTTIDHELYFGVAWSEGSGAWNATSGYALRTQEQDNASHERHATEDKVVTTATSTRAKFTISASNPWAAMIATFKPAYTASSSATGTLAAGSYQIATSSGSYSDTYTGSAAQDWSMVMAAFKPGSGGGSGTSTATTTVRYVLTDHLGGANVITDTSGTIVETLDYYPYGQARIDTKVGSYGGEKRKYIGQVYDEETQLSYLNARYYDGVRGQFTSQDPVFWEVGQTSDGIAVLANPQAMNSYAYAGGNPIVNKDSTGRFWWEGFYDWRGYNGFSGFMMKMGEIFGGHERALSKIQTYQSAVNADSQQNGVAPSLTNAIIYEEQSHLTPDEVLGREQLFPDIGSGGVGLMQVSGPIGKKYGGHTKSELAKDPVVNINVGTAHLGAIQRNFSSNNQDYMNAQIGTQYNGSAAYGQRIAAQTSNPNYNRNIIIAGLQSIVSSLQSLVASLISSASSKK